MRNRAETIFGVIWGVTVRIALVLAILYILWRVRAVIVAVILAVMVAHVALPAVTCIVRTCSMPGRARLHRFWATLLVFVVLAAATAGAVRLFMTPFQNELAQLSENMGNYIDQARRTLNKTAAWYNALPPDVRNLLPRQKAGDVFVEWTRSLVRATFAWVTHILDIILIPVLAFYFVLDSRSLKREFVALVPAHRRKEAVTLLRRASQILQNYVIGQLILCLIAAVVVGLALWMLRMDYVLVLAALAGVTRAIPIIGPIIGGIPIVLLALTHSTALAINLLIFFITLHFVESKVILPRLMSNRMRLHPAVIIVVLLIGGEFFGILGMFLAVPVAAVIREAVRFYVVRPRLTVVDGSNPAQDSEESLATREAAG